MLNQASADSPPACPPAAAGAASLPQARRRQAVRLLRRRHARHVGGAGENLTTAALRRPPAAPVCLYAPDSDVKHQLVRTDESRGHLVAFAARRWSSEEAQARPLESTDGAWMGGE